MDNAHVAHVGNADYVAHVDYVDCVERGQDQGENCGRNVGHVVDSLDDAEGVVVAYWDDGIEEDALDETCDDCALVVDDATFVSSQTANAVDDERVVTDVADAVYEKGEMGAWHSVVLNWDCLRSEWKVRSLAWRSKTEDRWSCC